MNMFKKDAFFLLVDDVYSVRYLQRRQLNKMGYHNIIEAENGIDAWNILEEHYGEKKEIDLIISDWRMPKMNGIELKKKLTESNLYENIPFLMVTSEIDRDKVEEALESGVTEFLTKPFIFETFEQKLQEIAGNIDKKTKE